MMLRILSLGRTPEERLATMGTKPRDERALSLGGGDAGNPRVH